MSFLKTFRLSWCCKVSQAVFFVMFGVFASAIMVYVMVVRAFDVVNITIQDFSIVFRLHCMLVFLVFLCGRHVFGRCLDFSLPLSSALKQAFDLGRS
ncbi:hypothetical protein PanWU01x14_094890 [Parasponia andersonii]|uniref:Uncharacterized protein n=1 Tax=Parasponia andersonii TaxID=3476 RepID=A0A2P5D5M4_PARAD|nr:hypothetical protein PanWU01x14_094890 [Parasponia andersonii]